MNLLKSPLRRTTAVLAGAFIGLAGAVAIAAPASAHAPSVSGASECVKDGKWTIDWSIGNDYNTDAVVKNLVLVPRDLTITGPATEEGKVIPAGSDKDATKQVHAFTEVSADVDSVKLRVRLKWSDYTTPVEDAKVATVDRPTEECAPENPPPSNPPPSGEPSTPPSEPAPGQPTPITEADCTTITLGLDNPEDGEDITLIFTTSKGETRELEIKAGEKKTEKFSATEGFKVTIGAEGVEETTEVVYEQPEGCSGGGGGEGDLPVTGAAVGGIAGGAGVLLAAGAVLFMVARRRRVKFTA